MGKFFKFIGWLLGVLIVLVVVLFLFGAKKLPELARSIGASAKEFKKGVEEGVEDDDAKSDSKEG